MTYKKTRWFIYTVLVGLLPFISRLIVFSMVKEREFSFLFNEVDWVAFGLILHVTNINELEHIDFDRSWKTLQNGLSIAFITVYSVILTLSLIQSIEATLFDEWVMKVVSILLSVASFALSYSIYDRLSKKMVK